MNEKRLPAKIREALHTCNWDLPLAARTLEMSLTQLDDALRQSKIIPKALSQWKRDLQRLPRLSQEYRRISLERIEEDLLRRHALYRSDAVDAIHALAMMPITDASGLMQVKLAAAVTLYKETGDRTVGSEIDATLRALNDAYHQNAPRIKSIRERTIEFETEPKLIAGE